MNATLGLDFGTESVRALFVSLSGRELATSTARYRHGQILEQLPGSSAPLPPHFALQHPEDWMEAASTAVRSALKSAKLRPENILGVGVDFTSCTMLPCTADGTPLCLLPKHRADPHSWPKLWKHHAAQSQTDHMNAVARQRSEPFLPRYGGAIGLEWFFPKLLEVLEKSPRAYAAADIWIEAGDWLVWQLVGGAGAQIPRSTCQAGYKGLWNASEGYPSPHYLKAVHRDFADVVTSRMPGQMISPGSKAGALQKSAAKRLGLIEGTPVSAAIIDAHAGVPGAGAANAGTLVMVLGTSACHMLNATRERFIEGAAGVVKDGILPGFFGYETGQAAVGDAFDWLRRLTGQASLSVLSQQAADLAPGAEGVRCVDWFNGCRTPLMNGDLRGAFSGLSLHHTSAHLYRALLEASAFGIRWIVELLRKGGVPVETFVATGGLPHHNPLIVQVIADVLDEPVLVHPCQQGPALGSAILGSLAAGCFNSPRSAIQAMAGNKSLKPKRYRPSKRASKLYAPIYANYRSLCDFHTKRQATA